MKASSSSIPIIFVASTPVESGLAKSLDQPGRNATGVSQDASPEFLQMRLQLLKEITGGASKFAYLGRGETLADQLDRQVIASKALGVRLFGVEISETPNETELRTALSQAADLRAQALLLATAQLTSPRMARMMADWAYQARLPVMCAQRELVQAGVLMSYDADALDLYREAARYLDRVLRGAKPAEMPIQLPSRFTCVVNLRTARALDLEVSSTMRGFVTDYVE